MTTIAPWLSVADATAAVAFYRQAFGATTGELVEFGGRVEVAELFVNGAPFWVQRDEELSPDHARCRVRMVVVVTDPDARFDQALTAGAVEMFAMHEQNGWRTGRLADPFGHQWEFARTLPSGR